MKIDPLTKKEQEVMDVLWNNDEPMSPYDIGVASPELLDCTIRQVTQKLLKKGYIKISGVGYTKNSLTRKFSPTFTQAEYLEKLSNKKSSLQFVSNYIENSSDLEALDTLEKMIHEKIKEVKGE